MRELNILIIDDHYPDINLLRVLIEEYEPDWQILEAQSVGEGLRYFFPEEHDPPRPWPDLVLLDIVMKGVDGNGALQFFRQETLTRDLPIIALSGHYFPDIGEQALANGANLFLPKHFKGEILDFQKDLLSAIYQLII